MHKEHKEQAPAQVKCAVLTISDTRDKQTDKSGKLIIDLLEENHHKVHEYEVLTDDRKLIEAAVTKLAANDDIEAIILNGGTGIAMRDVTIEAVQPLFTKELPGFGELFRMISYLEDIGSASMLSRATCGSVNHRLVFVLPGSTGAVRLAMNKLILPEIAHGVRELQKDLK